MSRDHYDVLVLGGGSAGLGAALSARRRGARVGLVEADRLGGDCTWTGCVPSKALIELAGQHCEGCRESDAHDSCLGDVFAKVRRTIRDIAEDDSPATLGAMGVHVIAGSASFLDPTTVRVAGRSLTATHVVIATGAKPVVPPIPGLLSGPFLTTDNIFELQALPERLVIVGAGAVGVELAQAFARLGVRVELIELAHRILAREETEAGAAIEMALRADGVTVHSGTALKQCRWQDRTWRLDVSGSRRLEADALLVAVGRAPDTDGLRLDAGGIDTEESGHIRVGPDFRTSAASVFAIGDVVNSLQFTHAAYEMARVAIKNALDGKSRTMDVDAIPYAIFTAPELAHVGLTENAAAAKFGTSASVSFLPDKETDRGRITGQTLGFTKLIAGPLHEDPFRTPLVGATIVSPRAGEMIHEAALAISSDLTVGHIIRTTHSYPTWSMSIGECASQFVSQYKGRQARQARLDTSALPIAES